MISIETLPAGRERPRGALVADPRPSSSGENLVRREARPRIPDLPVDAGRRNSDSLQPPLQPGLGGRERSFASTGRPAEPSRARFLAGRFARGSRHFGVGSPDRAPANHGCVSARARQGKGGHLSDVRSRRTCVERRGEACRVDFGVAPACSRMAVPRVLKSSAHLFGKPSLRHLNYSQSAETDIPATRLAPRIGNSSSTIRLAENQRKPLIRQIQIKTIAKGTEREDVEVELSGPVCLMGG